MLHDGVIDGFGHGQQACLRVAHVEALQSAQRTVHTSVCTTADVSAAQSPTDLDVQLQRHRPHVGVEVERGRGAAAKPVSHVFGVGQR